MAGSKLGTTNFWAYFFVSDIGVKLPDGTIRIIDRCSHILKLAQGVFVEPIRIENILLQNEFLEQIFVYGDIGGACLVATVVPSLKMVSQWAEQNALAIEKSRQHEFVNISPQNSEAVYVFGFV